MELRDGYKKTEIGNIPENWKIFRLKEIGIFSKGQGVKKDQSKSGEIPCVRYGELYTKHNYFIKEFHSFISTEIAKSSKKIKEGDILFAGSGETKEEIGKCAAFLGKMEAYAGGDIVIFSPTKCNSLFLGYLLNTKIVVIQKASKGQGDAVVHISAKQLQNIFIPIPPTESEQTAIATALSEADALISSLEKLIDKKRKIKQGVMQRLLKPKAGWLVKKFNELCWFQEGPGLRNWQFTKRGIKVINVTNLENGILNLDRTERHISLDEFHKMYEHFEIDEKDIVVASSGNSYGKVAVVRKQDLPLVMNTSVIRFKPLEGLDYKYLLIFLKSNYFKDQIDLLITGGAQPNFGPVHLNKISIYVPSTKEEQAQISNTIFDIDSEIELLEAKVDKFQLIKSGMMQNLLTGKIRLVKKSELKEA